MLCVTFIFFYEVNAHLMSLDWSDPRPRVGLQPTVKHLVRYGVEAAAAFMPRSTQHTRSTNNDAFSAPLRALRYAWRCDAACAGSPADFIDAYARERA